MSYINKGTRVFEETPKPFFRRVRSEARMKAYNSAEDLRTWSDDVEQRRQHILEFQAKNKGAGGPCAEAIVPLEALVNAIVAMKDREIEHLEKEIRDLEHAVNEASKIKLSPDQQKKFNTLKQELDAEFSDLEAESDDDDDNAEEE